MELPNYNRQLLLQLYTLCKEQQFCDCTIFIGNMHFRAHKLILAAASLLFRSLLDDTDTISIDSSVVTAEEFTILLEIVYTGKLPPGKHNFTKVISVADALQMFDVAVSCKKLLTDLMKRSTQSQMMMDYSVRLPSALTKAMPRTPQDSIIGDEAKTPSESDNMPVLSCRVQSQPLTTLIATEEASHLTVEATNPEAADMMVVTENFGKKASFDTSGTAISEKTHSNAATSLANVNAKIDMATSEAGTMLKSFEVVTSSATSVAVAGKAHSEILAASALEASSSPTHFEAVSGLALTEVGHGPENSQVMTGLTLSEKPTVSQTSEPDIGTATSKLTPFPAPFEEKTDMAPTETAPQKYISRSVSDVLPSAIVAVTVESGSPLTTPKSTEHPLIENFLGTVANSEEVERVSPHLKSLVAAAYDKAGVNMKEPHTFTDSDKLDSTSKQDGEDASHTEITQTKVLQQQTHSVCKLTSEELVAPAVSKCITGIGDKAEDMDEEVEPPLKKGRFIKQGSQEGDKALFCLLLENKDDLLQTITELSPILECLDTADNGFFISQEKKVILDCCEGKSPKEAMESLIKKVTDEKVLRAESLVKLLWTVKGAFPDLGLLLNSLEYHWKVTAQLSPEEYGNKLLMQYHEHLAEILTDPQVLLSGLAVTSNIAPREREVIEKIVKTDSCVNTFDALASAVLEEKTLSSMAIWQLVLALQDAGIPSTLLEDIKRTPGAELFFQLVVKREADETEMLLQYTKIIREAIGESSVLERIAPGEDGLKDAVKELLFFCEKEDRSASCAKQFLSAILEKSIPTLMFCHVLCSLQESFPNVQPLMQELEQMGLLTAGDGEMENIRKWKVNNEYEVEALDKKESNPELVEMAKDEALSVEENSLPVKKEGKRLAIRAKKNYICKYCNKIFHFRCRLEVHIKRCRMALEKPVQCQDCNEVKASKKELERHRQESHSYPNSDRTARGRRKRLLVTCDICGKQFAHPSGMQYHKRTEHFDEKPFSCNECGAKFAANSTLKNHQRLHTGERPYMCKHCQMTFTQAAALAYHTKKKHSEGKMYACQYCDAVFAQSIELTRHVRTHTGDKPYVCRECGKGFSQANGLSVHLRTFHNIEDPYDCQKCRMSFPTLDEHRKHIQEVHSREYHPCPTCGKIFSAPSLLERHMVIHVGGKPYNCEICDKAYQQLSGLWYHNRTHHPDIFAAQNRRSSKFTSLLCISCDKGFSTATALQTHVKAEHADLKLPECDKCQQIFPSPAALQVHMKCKHSGSQPFRCLYCTEAFRFPGALQHHVATEHFSQTENSFGCQLCGELFTSSTQLQKHYESEHPEVATPEGEAMQAVHTTEDVESSEQMITLEESHLAESQLIVAVPDSHGSQASSEIVAVSMKDLLDGTVALICRDHK
ncbi:zinc finger and BTB domain-containing protein 40 [Ambystoma mexicanum]|uniref:zinc finger and BTB domain-containing protein 40 n=1 Tax=Ambystoma mexicanum TaxID=8296 RepID=UPI0037E8EAF8